MVFRYDKEKEELVVSESTRTEYHQMELWFSRKIKGHQFNPLVKRGLWNGMIKFFKDGRLPLGLWREAFTACREIEVPFKIENKEDFPVDRDITLKDVQDFCDDFFKDHKMKDGTPFKPYEHQVEAAFKILKNRYCMAEVATSGGKSLIIFLVILYTLKKVKTDARFVLIVPSITLVTQMHDDFIGYYHNLSYKDFEQTKKFITELELEDGSFLELNNDDYVDTVKRGRVQVKDMKSSDHLSKDNKIVNLIRKEVDTEIRIEEVMSDRPRKFSGANRPNIFIGTYQSLEKYDKEFFEQFHGVITDEAHKAGNNTIKTILKKTITKAHLRFGVSGTFPLETTAESLSIQMLLGPKITEVSADELRAKGIITPMDIKVLILNHNKPEIYQRLKQVRKADGKAAFDIEKKLVQQSESRLEIIKKLVRKCENNTMVMFHSIEHGQKVFNALQEEMGEDIIFHYIDGTVGGKKRDVILEDMNKLGDKPKVLICSYMTMGTGISVNEIYNIIFIDSYKSEQIVIQSVGRGLRKAKNKEVVNIFDLVDIFDPKNMHNVLYGHYKEREKFYTKRKYPFKIHKINLEPDNKD